MKKEFKYTGKIGKVKMDKDIIEIFLAKENEKFAQYFNFKITASFSKKQKFVIKNAEKSQYPKGWNDYKIFYSFDGMNWERSKTGNFNGKEFSFEIDFQKENKKIYLAWYQPYTFKNYQDFLSKNKLKNIKDGNLNYLIFNQGKKETIVLLARQHPGEVMSSFFIEGLIEEILKNQNQDFEILIFPLINFIGVEKENHRFVNGIDFNRSWGRNDVEEIKKIKDILKNKKVRLVVDVHGDEVSKINFSRKSRNKEKNKIIDLIKEDLPNFLVLDYDPLWKRILKKVIRKNPAKTSGVSAEKYFEIQKIPSITLELSARFSPSEHREFGRKFYRIFEKLD